MLVLHNWTLYLHIAFGSCAIFIFWIPVLTRKGNLNHKRFGRYFASTMYAVAISGFAMASLDLLFPAAIHAAQQSLTPAQIDAVVVYVRSSAIFLLSLSILVLTTTRQGWLSMLHKADRKPLRSPVHIALCSSLVAVGVVLFFAGIAGNSILFMIFSVLQIVLGVNCLRYNFKQVLGPKQWWIEHLGGFIASGIGAYTAFFVFGGRRMFDSLFGSVYGDYSIILWVAPGVIGGIAISVVSRHYRRRFGGELVRNQSSRSPGITQ